MYCHENSRKFGVNLWDMAPSGPLSTGSRLCSSGGINKLLGDKSAHCQQSRTPTLLRLDSQGEVREDCDAWQEKQSGVNSSVQFFRRLRGICDSHCNGSRSPYKVDVQKNLDWKRHELENAVGELQCNSGSPLLHRWQTDHWQYRGELVNYLIRALPNLCSTLPSNSRRNIKCADLVPHDGECHITTVNEAKKLTFVDPSDETPLVMKMSINNGAVKVWCNISSPAASFEGNLDKLPHPLLTNYFENLSICTINIEPQIGATCCALKLWKSDECSALMVDYLSSGFVPDSTKDGHGVSGDVPCSHWRKGPRFPCRLKRVSCHFLQRSRHRLTFTGGCCVKHGKIMTDTASKSDSESLLTVDDSDVGDILFCMEEPELCGMSLHLDAEPMLRVIVDDGDKDEDWLTHHISPVCRISPIYSKSFASSIFLSTSDTESDNDSNASDDESDDECDFNWQPHSTSSPPRAWLFDDLFIVPQIEELDLTSPPNDVITCTNVSSVFTDSCNAKNHGASQSQSAQMEKLNAEWNEFYSTSEDVCYMNHSSHHRMVQFCTQTSFVTILNEVEWADAYKDARHGPWEEYARDRERFRRRIEEAADEISPVLAAGHRAKILQSLMAGTVYSDVTSGSDKMKSS